MPNKVEGNDSSKRKPYPKKQKPNLTPHEGVIQLDQRKLVKSQSKAQIPKHPKA